MKLNENLVADLPPHLLQFLRGVARKVNALAGGLSAGRDNTANAAPTTGDWTQGDQVLNAVPVELGAIGSKYVVIGWICVAGGTPGTWAPMRTLTGN